MPADVQSRASTFENLNGVAGEGARTNQGAKGNPCEPVKAGESKVLLDVAGSGVVRRIWMSPDRGGRTPAMLRSLRLRMYWDGAEKPAVDAPLGDFFCAGLGQVTAFQSTLFASPEGRSFNSYIAMPFRKAARIVLTNEGSRDVAELYFEVDFTRESVPDDALYFHAWWNRRKAIPLGEDFELLPRVEGRGRFLGASVGVNVNPVYAGLWYGEGEVKMYLDGDRAHPTIAGTGTEDYVSSGWGEGRFAQDYQGCTIADPKGGHFAFYRFHLPDPIYFHRDFRATIQEIGSGPRETVLALLNQGVPMKPVGVSGVGMARVRLLDANPAPALTDEKFTKTKTWVSFYRTDDYSATSYFYLDRPFCDLPALTPVAERLP